MTIDHSFTFASATHIAAAIRAKEISCVEILEHYLARISAYNKAVNAVVVLDTERARMAARIADLAIQRDLPVGPLHGVPMTIKEAFDIDGLPSTWGHEHQRNNIATSNATAVDRFTAAGAIIFGKTNVPTDLADWQTFNPVYGTTNNPWQIERVPGGSSGGSAAALAAGFCALETGSDIGASIRNPAHYCGVYGHKPTFGIASSQGHALPQWQAQPELDIAVIGPMARSATDLATALDVIAGPTDIDATGWQLNLPRNDKPTLSDFTVGLIYSDPEAEVDELVQAQLRALGDFLKHAGVNVREHHKPDISSRDAHETYIGLLRAATSTAADHDEFLQNCQRATSLSDNADDYQSRMLRGTTMRHRDWLFLDEKRHRMRQQWRDYFQSTDLLLCPAATTVAFEHNQKGPRWERMISVNGNPQATTTALFWAGYAGCVYLPATVAPIGVSTDDLPVGVQIVGPQYHDHRCIHFAALVEQHYHSFLAPPAFR